MHSPALLNLATEHFQDLCVRIDDPLDILSLSSTCLTISGVLRSPWVWKEHLLMRGIDTSSLHLPQEQSSSTPTIWAWRDLARLSCSLFIVRHPLTGTPLLGMDNSPMARSLIWKNALGASYLRKLNIVTSSIDSHHCLICGDTALQRLLTATNGRSGPRTQEWAFTMARLLYHDVVIHGVVCSVPLNAIQDHMYTFPSRDDPIYNAPLTRHATMDIETSTWATLITMRMLRSIAALPLNHRVTPSARVPPEFSAHDDLLASTLSSWDQGHGQTFVGYYTYSVPHPFHDGQEDEGNGGQVDPPTTFTLRYDHGTGALNGKGHDLAGGFTVVGHATRDGFVSFHKKYAGHRWFWRGVILKWGIAGLWGGAIRRGMFYMWPADKTKAAINMATG